MFGQEEEERQHQQQQQAMVIKGKRTKRLRHASPLTPLVTMSNSSSSNDDTTGIRLATSSSSTITTTQEEEDMAHCLILLAQGGGAKLETYEHHHQQQSLVGVVYECKTCNRCFPSFQALGGHRASHKKPKMTPQPEPSSLAMDMGLSLQLACNSSNTLRAINFNPNENLPNFKPKENLPNKPKAHPCGICGAEFSSGQALGGHMRRHRPLATNTMTPATPPAINLQLCLDLNLPAEEEDQEAETPKFMFGSNENTLVFTAGALVDCRY